MAAARMSEIPTPVAVLLGLVAGFFLVTFFPLSSSSSCAALPPSDDFGGPPYVKEGQTVARRVLASTPFARVELHTVRPPRPGAALVTDWLWLDIKDQVEDDGVGEWGE